MVRTLPFVRPSGIEEQKEAVPQAVSLAKGRPAAGPTTALTCEHRTVSRDGRIVCKKIVEGQAEVAPNVCRQCPSRTVNCQHLRFSLRLSSPSPLVVRFNGRTELWDDGPAVLGFDRAACALRVTPIHTPQTCAECSLRQAQQCEAEAGAALGSGRVVPFPREAVAAAG
jgi:hypothetical protein